jgi:nucleoside-diphosphate-sugar epimerase
LSTGDLRTADHSGIFLAGATGLVGGLLLLRLAEECPEGPVYALVRNRETATWLPDFALSIPIPAQRKVQ